MKLSKEDEAYFLRVGHPKEDLEQLRRSTYKTDYSVSYNGEVREDIPVDDAIELLGREIFLSGLSRSAFHWSAAREIPNTNDVVYFDSSRLFK